MMKKSTLNYSSWVSSSMRERQFVAGHEYRLKDFILFHICWYFVCCKLAAYISVKLMKLIKKKRAGDEIQSSFKVLFLCFQCLDGPVLVSGDLEIYLSTKSVLDMQNSSHFYPHASDIAPALNMLVCQPVIQTEISQQLFHGLS